MLRAARWTQLLLSLCVVGVLLTMGIGLTTAILALMAMPYVALATVALNGARFASWTAGVMTLGVGLYGAFFVVNAVTSGFDWLRGRFSVPENQPMYLASPTGEVIVVENPSPEMLELAVPFYVGPYAALFIAVLAAFVCYAYSRVWIQRRRAAPG